MSSFPLFGPTRLAVLACRQQIEKFHAAGVEHFVFDLRTRFGEFEELVEMIGAEVLPALR